MVTVWEQSLESGGGFTHSMARVFSQSAILTVVNVEEYGKSMERVWPKPRVLVAFA